VRVGGLGYWVGRALKEKQGLRNMSVFSIRTFLFAKHFKSVFASGMH
jgi:hypothetical protein